MEPITPKETERQSVLECIRYYRDLPSLWNLSSQEYYNRIQKKKDYEKLLAKYREQYPKATVQDLKKKLNTLRTNYRKELKRVKRTGDEPRMWYFYEMDFLKEALRCKPVERTDSKNEEDGDDENSIECEEYSIEEDPIEDQKPTYFNIEKRAAETSVKQERQGKRTKLDYQCYEDIGEIKDEHYYWAMALAADVRKMEKKQQLFAKKAIAEIVLDGQMEQLTRDSVKITASPSTIKIRRASPQSDAAEECETFSIM